MISAIISLAGIIISCVSALLVAAVVLVARWLRKPNEKQIRALRILLPTDAERPLELHPLDLERLAAYVYQRLGYRNVKHTGASSTTDGGVDVWMLSRQGYVEIVQCKQWTRAHVGSSELIEFAKVMRQQHANVGHYWAPWGFSKPALKYVENMNNIFLYTDYEIRKLLEQATEIDKAVAARKTSMPVPKKKTGWTVAQVTIIFGMVLLAFSTIYCLFANLVAGGS